MSELSIPNETIRQGSTAYYVIRFAKPKFRNDLTALFLWKNELRKLYELSDPGVARIKLQWWLDQISESKELPTITFIQNLSRLHANSEECALAFKNITAEIDNHLRRTPYSNTKALWQGALNIGGSFGTLIQIISNSPISNTTQRIGAWIFIIESIQNLGHDFRHNINILPTDLLKQYKSNNAYLMQKENENTVTELLQEFIYQLQTLDETEVITENVKQSPLHRYYQLRQKLLTLLVEENLSVMQQRISLTPLRKLWNAFW